MSKSLIKLLDSAIIPALVMVCSKVIGLWIVNQIFNLSFGLIPNPNNLIGISVSYSSQEDLMVSSSYSNLFMYGCLFLSFSFVLVQATFFHDSHITPFTLSKLAANNLLDLIKDSFNLYHEASIWLIFIWSASIIILINSILGSTYSWIAVLSVVGSLIVTVVLVRDVGKEIRVAKSKLKRGNLKLEYK